jgi:hypothetical protein
MKSHLASVKSPCQAIKSRIWDCLLVSGVAADTALRLARYRHQPMFSCVYRHLMIWKVAWRQIGKRIARERCIASDSNLMTETLTKFWLQLDILRMSWAKIVVTVCKKDRSAIK